MLTWIAAATLLAWLVLMFARGGFWRTRPAAVPPAPEPEVWPHVVVVVPARNEAATIGPTLKSLRAQDSPGISSVIVVDDCSSDGTAAAARHAAGGMVRFTLIRGRPRQRRSLRARLIASATIDCSFPDCDGTDPPPLHEEGTSIEVSVRLQELSVRDMRASDVVHLIEHVPFLPARARRFERVGRNAAIERLKFFTSACGRRPQQCSKTTFCRLSEPERLRSFLRTWG